MKNTPLLINMTDHQRLRPHLESANDGYPKSRLREVLSQAQPTPPEKMPHDVVTMNSHIVVRYPDWGDHEEYVLSYPDQTPAETALSVLSPLGCALLASREGDEITFMGARRPRRVVIDAITFQPEREGRFDL